MYNGRDYLHFEKNMQKRKGLKRLIANNKSNTSLTGKCLRKEIVNAIEYCRRFIGGESIGQNRTAELLGLFSTA
jgi:hypothetical protein